MHNKQKKAKTRSIQPYNNNEKHPSVGLKQPYTSPGLFTICASRMVNARE